MQILITICRNSQRTDRESGGCGTASSSVRLSPLGLNIVYQTRYSSRTVLVRFIYLASYLFSKFPIVSRSCMTSRYRWVVLAIPLPTFCSALVHIWPTIPRDSSEFHRNHIYYNPDHGNSTPQNPLSDPWNHNVGLSEPNGSSQALSLSARRGARNHFPI